MLSQKTAKPREMLSYAYISWLLREYAHKDLFIVSSVNACRLFRYHTLQPCTRSCRCDAAIGWQSKIKAN